MALIKCDECGREISTKATTCPHCGAPQPNEREQERLREMVEAQRPDARKSPFVDSRKRKTKEAKSGNPHIASIIWLLAVTFIVVAIVVSNWDTCSNGTTGSSTPPVSQNRPSVARQAVYSTPGGTQKRAAEGRGKTAQTRIATKKKRVTYAMKETVHVGYMTYAVWRAEWKDSIGGEYLRQKPDAHFLVVNLTARNDDKKARMIPPLNLIDESGAEYNASSKAWVLDNEIDVLDSLNPAVSKQGDIVFDVPPEHAYKLKVSGGYWSSDHALIEIKPIE